MLPLPIPVPDFDKLVLTPALALLPRAMDSAPARIIAITVCLQESKLAHRWQVLNGGGKGPARGLPQFEKIGVQGVMEHPTSRYWVQQLCVARGVAFTLAAIYKAIEVDDILAVGLARLLMFTDPKKLPAIGDVDGAWIMYAKRCWKPGKPHRATWGPYYQQALDHVMQATL